MTLIVANHHLWIREQNTTSNSEWDKEIIDLSRSYQFLPQDLYIHTRSSRCIKMLQDVGMVNMYPECHLVIYMELTAQKEKATGEKGRVTELKLGTYPHRRVSATQATDSCNMLGVLLSLLLSHHTQNTLPASRRRSKVSLDSSTPVTSI